MDVSKFSHLIIGRGWFLMKTYGGPKLLRNRLINWSKSKNNNSESSKSHINLVLKWKTNEEPIQRKNHYRRNSYNNLLTKLLKLDSLYVTSANVPLAISTIVVQKHWNIISMHKHSLQRNLICNNMDYKNQQ